MKIKMKIKMIIKIINYLIFFQMISKHKTVHKIYKINNKKKINKIKKKSKIELINYKLCTKMIIKKNNSKIQMSLIFSKSHKIFHKKQKLISKRKYNIIIS